MKILDIILEAEGPKVVVIGDSIAVGINGGEDLYCKGGINSTAVLAKVTAFVATGKAKGATVILSSGASNSTYERPNGEKQIFSIAPVEQQLKLLKDAGATVALVGTGSEKSKTVTNQHGTYFVNFKDQQVNQKLENAASTYGATFLGPLEKFDPSINSGKGDGIHPYNGYNQLKQAAISSAPPPVNKGTANKPQVATTTNWARNPDGTIKQYDDQGNYIQGSKLAAMGFGNLGLDDVPGQTTAGQTTSGSLGNVKSTERAKTAVKFFISKGWTPAQAAGIVGNLQAESGENLDNTIWGDKHTSYGIAQWRADRLTRYKKEFGKDLTKTSFEEQLNYVQWELDHTETKAAGYIRSAKTAKEAAAAFDQHYERSSGEHRAKRIAYSNNLLGTLTA